MGGGHIPSAGLPLVGELLSYGGLPFFFFFGQANPSGAARGAYMSLAEAGRESAAAAALVTEHTRKQSATYRYSSDVSEGRCVAVHRSGVT